LETLSVAFRTADPGFSGACPTSGAPCRASGKLRISRGGSRPKVFKIPPPAVPRGVFRRRPEREPRRQVRRDCFLVRLAKRVFWAACRNLWDTFVQFVCWAVVGAIVVWAFRTWGYRPSRRFLAAVSASSEGVICDFLVRQESSHICREGVKAFEFVLRFLGY
jgi:hypothetical protein